MKRTALLFILLLVANPALAQEGTVHEDYRRAFPDDASVHAAGQRVLDYAEFAVGDAIAVRDQRLQLYSVLFGGFGHEREWLALSRQEATGMQQAMGRSTADYPIPDLLPILEPLSAKLARNVGSLINGLSRVGADDQDILVRILEVKDVELTARNSLRLLDEFDALDYETSRLRYLFGLILEATSRLRVDPTLLPDAGEGEDGSEVASRVLVEPNPAYFGQAIRILVVDPSEPGAAVRVDFGGTPGTATLDSAGVAIVYMTVPWNANVGSNLLTITWGANEGPVPLEVLQVPVTWRSVRATPLENTLRITGSASDAHGAGLADATIRWTSVTGSGATKASADGDVAFEVASHAATGTLRYAGNRTHAAASATWDITRSLSDLGVGADASQAAAKGAAGAGAVEDGLPSAQIMILWLLLMLVLVLAGLAAAALRGRRDASAHADSRGREPPAGSGAGPGDGSPQLEPGHPLLRVLERAGFQPEALTLREAEPLWQALGAPPRLSSWLHHYEAAYYTQRPEPPIPGEVLVWARRT